MHVNIEKGLIRGPFSLSHKAATIEQTLGFLPFHAYVLVA